MTTTGFNQSTGASDPFEFVRNLWGSAGFPLPGMVTPTLDSDELGKRIAEMKSVENWLRMNLGMLQMTIQSLEMQQTTLNAMRAMGASYQQQAAASSATAAAGSTGKDALEGNANAAANPFANMAAAASAAAAMWPWKLMDSASAAASQPAADAAAKGKETPEAPKTKPAAAGKAKPAAPKGG